MVLKVCLTNYNWLNSVNERDRTGLSEQVIPHYSQKGNHQLKKTNTHTWTYLEQEQQLEFLLVLFDSPSLVNSSGIQNETFAEIQLDCQTGFYLIPLAVAIQNTQNFMDY